MHNKFTTLAHILNTQERAFYKEERARRIEQRAQVDAGEAIGERDLLRAEVLLDGHRIVRAALHCRVVAHDHTLAPEGLCEGSKGKFGRVRIN